MAEYPNGDTTSESEDEGDIFTSTNVCVACLLTHLTTWIFMPCRHVNCCTDCSEQLKQSGQTCQMCRSTIEDMFEIFTR